MSTKEEKAVSRTLKLRADSGTITYSDPLTSFLYQLMRDEMPAGKVEQLVMSIVDESKEDIIFTNGWLAQYAHNLAETLQDAKAINLENALMKAFTNEETKRLEEMAKSIEDRKNYEKKSLDDKDIAGLEDKIRDLSTDSKANPDPLSNMDSAKDMVEKLKAEGAVSAEDAARLLQELNEMELDEEKELDIHIEVANECKCGETEKCQNCKCEANELKVEPQVEEKADDAETVEEFIIPIAEKKADEDIKEQEDNALLDFYKED